MKIQKIYERLDHNKRQYNILRFPEDIDVNGSYNVMFININAVSGSKYAGKEYKIVDGEGTTPRYQESSSGSLARKLKGLTKRIDTSIALYIPNSIETSYGADWTSSDLGAVGAVFDAGTGVGDLTTAQGWKDVWDAAKIIAPEALLNTVTGAAQSLTGVNLNDAKNAYNRTVPNPYTEVLFNGVNNRTFSFTFKFIPKSQKEQQQIKKIIDSLKFHRAPEVKFGQVNNYWLFPSEFDITFLNRTEENKYLFKVSTCVMTNMSVSQGGDSHFATHADGAPFQTEMTLEFMELELLTKERMEEGY